MRQFAILFGGVVLSILIATPVISSVEPIQIPAHYKPVPVTVAARLNEEAINLFYKNKDSAVSIGKIQEQLGSAIAKASLLRIEGAGPRERGMMQAHTGLLIAVSTRIQRRQKELLEEATGYLLTAAAVDPFVSTIHFNCAVVFAEKAQYRHAVMHLIWALSLEPENETWRSWLFDLRSKVRA